MSFILAIALSVSAFIGLPALSDGLPTLPTSDAPIVASSEAKLPSYLTQVTTPTTPSDLDLEDTTDPTDLDMEDTTDPTPTTCEEDMPCWDCQTMGNLQCGPTSALPATTCEEDMPCWDCETMGNKQCGVDPTMEADAYLSYESQTGQPINDETALMLSYVATVPVQPNDILLPNQFAIPSSNHANVWHIMQWDSINRA